MELRDLVSELSDLKDRKSALADETKEVNANIEDIEGQIVLGLLNVGNDKQSFPGIGTISITPKDYPSIKNKELFYDFLHNSGQSGLIQETVNARTLASWFKEQALEKDEYEAIGLANFQKTKINLRRS